VRCWRSISSRWRRSFAGQPLDDREELERAERLAQDGVGARRAELRDVGARQEDHRDVSRLRIALEGGAVFDAVDARHQDVENDRVRFVCGDPARCHCCAVSLVELEIEHLERRAE
jgi:hypothetical protein